MNSAFHHLPAYILAGGKSSRMGTDKGLLDYHGKPVLSHILDVVRPLTSQIYLLSSKPEYQSLELEMVPDLFPETGPAGAIAGMLNHLTFQHALLVPCDMPLLHEKAVSGILQFALPGKITVPVHHGRMYPLFGIYPKSVEEPWCRLVRSGLYRIKDLLTHFDVHFLETDELPEFDPDPFFNLNTPEDFQRLNAM